MSGNEKLLPDLPGFQFHMVVFMKKNKINPIPYHIETDPGNQFSTVTNIAKYFIKTIDGIYALSLSIAYLGWALILCTGLIDVADRISWSFKLGLFFMPVLFFLVVLQHRIRSSVTDKPSAIFCIVSNTALALAPIYNYFFRS